MRILHLADLHLDRPFPSLGAEQARERRRELRRAFDRALDLAVSRAADLVTIGGDLWEDEHLTADTRAAVAASLGRLGRPALIVCGNHDPFLPGGHYARAAWPSSVELFGEGPLREVRVGEVSVWGVGWAGGSLDLAWLEAFRVPDDGRVHILLIHGSARQGLPGGSDPGEAYAPFDAEAVSRAGFALCLAGHYHGASRVGPVVYPGSPEPFGWGDTGRHTVALVDVAPGSDPSVESIDINQRRYETREIDCELAASSAEVAERVAARIEGSDPAGLCLRVVLAGQVAPECEIDLEALAGAFGDRFAAFAIEDRTAPAFDYDRLARLEGATGCFVTTLRRLLDSAEEPRERRMVQMALDIGLHALAGRRQVARVD